MRSLINLLLLLIFHISGQGIQIEKFEVLQRIKMNSEKRRNSTMVFLIVQIGTISAQNNKKDKREVRSITQPQAENEGTKINKGSERK